MSPENHTCQKPLKMGFASPGRYQLLAGFLLGCMHLPVTFTDNILTLYTATQMHRCRIRYNESSKIIGESEYRPLVEKYGKKLYASCEMYVDPKDHSLGTQPCVHGWEYISADEEWTLVTEWNLVCEREYLLNLVPYVYYAGAMVGCLIFGILGDHCGRRCILLAALLFHTAIGVGMYFLPAFTFFAVCYAFQGFFVMGVQCLCIILLLESISYPYHLKSVLLVAVFCPLGTITLSVLAWLIRNWRYIQVALTSPGIVCIGYFWLLPRSLPWLLVEGRTAEAEKQLVRSARFNKTSLPQNFRLHLQHFVKAIRSYLGPSGSCHSLEAVTGSAKIRRYMFTLYYIWFVVFFHSNASTVRVPALEENKYAFLFVKGIMDLGMVILLYFLAHRFGPRFAQAAFLIIGGLLSVSASFVEYYLTQELNDDVSENASSSVSLLSPVLASIGKAAVRCTASTLFFFSIKVFPTGIRGIGVGICLFWSRCALLLGHYVSSLEIEEYFLTKAVCGTLSVIAGCLTFLLPISTRRPLPNVRKEIEQNIIIDGGIKKSHYHFQNRLAATKALIMNSVHHGHRCAENVGPSIISKMRRSCGVYDDNDSISSRGVDSQYSSDIRDVPTLQVERTSCPVHHPAGKCSSKPCVDAIPGPSRPVYLPGEETHCAVNDADDNESRLTDLEDELTKIWGLGQLADKGNNSAESSLREFPRGDIRDHFQRMHETSF